MIFSGIDLCLLFLLQLSLTQSDISHIGSMRVEGIVHPTTAEIDLKEEIGKAWGLERGHSIAHCHGLSRPLPEIPCGNVSLWDKMASLERSRLCLESTQILRSFS